LSVTAAKLQQALPEAKRDGNSVAGALSESLLYSNASVSRAGSVLEQIEFIPRLVEDLKSNPEKVVKAMDQLRQHCEYSCVVTPLKYLTHHSDSTFRITLCDYW